MKRRRLRRLRIAAERTGTYIQKLTRRIRARLKDGLKAPGWARARWQARRRERRLGRRIAAAREWLARHAWGGSRWIMVHEVRPVVERHGISRTSSKRKSDLGNPDSDHFVLNRLSFADDYGTDSNHALADEIGRELGIGPVTDYVEYFIERRHTGRVRTYRVQIIAQTHGSGPHLHVGIKRVS